jgi:hypothetical protein
VEEKNGENVKENGRKGKEKQKRESKRVQSMQNREELRQKGHSRNRKTTSCKREKITFSEGGGGGNKYRFQTEI